MALPPRPPHPVPAFQDAVRAYLGRAPRLLELEVLSALAQDALDREVLEGVEVSARDWEGSGPWVPVFATTPEEVWRHLRGAGAAPTTLWAGEGQAEAVAAFALGAGLSHLEAFDLDAAIAFGVGGRPHPHPLPQAGAVLHRLESGAPEPLGRGAQARALKGIPLLPAEPAELVAWAVARGVGLEAELGREPSAWGFAILEPGASAELEAWGIRAVAAGRILDGDRIRIHRNQILEVDLPVALQTTGWPAPFAGLRAEPEPDPDPHGLPPDLPEDALERTFHELVGACLAGEVLEAAGPPGAGEDGLALCLTSARRVALDPFWGAVSAVLEAAQGLAFIGAEAVGLAIALPQEVPPEVLLGLRQASLGLDLPVLDVRRRPGLHTPVLAALGEVEPGASPVDVEAPEARGLTGAGPRTCGVGYRRAFDGLYVLGAGRDELGGSRYLAARGGRAACPEPWLDEAFRLQACVREGIRMGLFRSAHGVGRGGLLVAALEGTVPARLGCQLILARAGQRLDALCFGEAPGRALVTVSGEGESALRTLATTHRIPFAKVGVIGGDRFTVAVDGVPLLDASLADLLVYPGATPPR